METENTVGGRIEKQDPKAYELLQNIIKRPGMYVGIGRLDYVDNLFTGYYIGRASLGQENGVVFLPHNELQYWLLHTQSASVDGNIHGRTLFYRCFGIREMAFENYKVFLNANLPDNPKDVYSGLWDYYNKHDIVPYYFEDEAKEELSPDY